MRRTIVAVVSSAMLFVVACGDDSGSDAGTSEGIRRIEITAAEFAFSPDAVTVDPGETVEFVIGNDGSLAHEFVVSSQAEIDEHIEGGHAEHSEDDEMGDMEDAADKIEVEPGGTGTLVYTFPSDTDKTHFVCLIPGHYEAGMVGELVLSS